MNWIVTVCRNGLDMTKRAVDSFLAQDVGEVGLLVIDNASTDGTREHFRAFKPSGVRFEYIRNPEPASVARSWNFALDMVFAADDHALVCNNDVELLPCTYRLLLADRAPFATGRGVLTKQEMINGDIRPDDRKAHPDFACYCIKLECWEKVGPFDEAMRSAYTEDNDLHVRMHIAGIEAVSLGLPVAHYAGGTQRANPHEQEQICMQAERNRERFAAKWGFRIPSEQINDGKYWEFFTKSRPDWRPFEPSTWIW